MSYRSNAGLRSAVERESIGFGAYAKSVARITITPRGGTPVEAVLYHGF